MSSPFFEKDEYIPKRKNVFLVKAFLIFVVVLLHSNCLLAGNNNVHGFVDRHIIGVEVGKTYLKELEGKLGEGSSVLNGDGRCFFNKEQGVFVIFGLCEDNLICDFTLSNDKEMWAGCENYKIDALLKTDKGIALGDEIEKVIDIYGMPKGIEKLRNVSELKNIEYHTNYKEDPNVNMFYDSSLYFKDGKLIRIFVHDGN